MGFTEGSHPVEVESSHHREGFRRHSQIHETGLGGVDLGDLVGLGLKGAPIELGLGDASVGEVFWGHGAFVGLGEPLVPLGLGDSGAWEEVFEALGLGASRPLGSRWSLGSPSQGSPTQYLAGSYVMCGVNIH
jgi:hypothetical protein